MRIIVLKETASGVLKQVVANHLSWYGRLIRYADMSCKSLWKFSFIKRQRHHFGCVERCVERINRWAKHPSCAEKYSYWKLVNAVQPASYWSNWGITSLSLFGPLRTCHSVRTYVAVGLSWGSLVSKDKEIWRQKEPNSISRLSLRPIRLSQPPWVLLLNLVRLDILG